MKYVNLPEYKPITPTNITLQKKVVLNDLSELSTETTLKKENYPGITLNVKLSTSSLKFTNLDDYVIVYNGMLDGDPPLFRICIIYDSGLKNYYYPTCVKQSYISLNAKAGSCELHIKEDGSFTRSGTNLW